MKGKQGLSTTGWLLTWDLQDSRSGFVQSIWSEVATSKENPENKEEEKRAALGQIDQLTGENEFWCCQRGGGDIMR